MRILKAVLETYNCSFGDFELVDTEEFYLQKRNWFSPWEFASEFGIGIEPGDQFDLYPVQIGRQEFRQNHHLKVLYLEEFEQGQAGVYE